VRQQNEHDDSMAVSAGAVRQLELGQWPGERELEQLFEPERQHWRALAGV
jgi:hypothetical protein